MERNVFEERFFHAASVTEVARKAQRTHPYSELNINSTSLIQKVHSSVRRAPAEYTEDNIRSGGLKYVGNTLPHHTPMLTRLGNSGGRKGLTLMLI